MRENHVEATLREAIKKRGGWAIKFLPSVSGLPDRIVLMPGGRIYFVELKSPTGYLKPHQTVVHNRLRTLGFVVEVLNTPATVNDWVSSLP